MTMIDENLLSTLFARTGNGFDVPVSGPNDILDAARVGTDPAAQPDGTAMGGAEGGDAGPRPLTAFVRSHRILAVAACLAAAALVAVGVTQLGKSNPSGQLNAGAPLVGAATGLGHVSASTTIPSIKGPTGTGGTGGFSVGAPTPAVASPGLQGASAGATRSGAGGSGPAAGPASPPTRAPGSPTLPSGVVGQPSKIEQTGTLSLLVGRGALSGTMTKLTLLAGAFNGFVANSETQGRAIPVDGAPYGSITLQVPVASFSDVLKAAQKLGKTSDLSTKATDVTGQYVDLQSRIAALEVSRQQYLTIMTKATSVGDVLAVQSQLDNLQSEIEQLQGQLQVLDGETAYSTLTVMVSERGAPSHHTTPHPPSGLSKAWHDSVRGFVNGVEWLIRGAGPVLFVLLCLGALILGSRLGWRRYQRHNL